MARRFEYAITLYPVEMFREFAFFCSAEGSCELREIPDDQVKRLNEALNDMGDRGWELVELVSRPSGLVAIWKRERDSSG